MAKNKTQCSQGHYYNAEKYYTCPVCNNADAIGLKKDDVPPEKKITTASRSEIGVMQPYAAPQAEQGDATMHWQTPTESMFSSQGGISYANADEKTASAFQNSYAHYQSPHHATGQEENSALHIQPSHASDTEPALNTRTHYVPEAAPMPRNTGIVENRYSRQPTIVPQSPYFPQPPQSQQVSQRMYVPQPQQAQENPPTHYPAQSSPSPYAIPTPPEKQPGASLQAAVDAVKSYNDAEDVKTVAVWSAPGGSEPVVGWLVCVKGEYIGQSFNIKSGNNAVGRSMNMDVHLAKEQSVSRHKHCIITYEPNSQAYYVQQGESSGITYLNGNMVMTPTEIKARDSIRIGKAEFILIPLCVDGFRWDGLV